VALNLELVNAEAARPNEHLDALDYIFRGRAIAAGKPPSAENYAEAIELFKRALTLSPSSVEAQSWLALALANRVLDDMTDTVAADIVRAERLIEQALKASSRGAQAHFAKGQLLRAKGRPEEAIAEYEAAIAFNRNLVSAYANLGRSKFLTGSIEELIPAQRQAIRLSPRDPYISAWFDRIGTVHLLQSRIDEAIIWLEEARRANRVYPLAHAHLASAYALKGESGRAAAELAEARRLNHDDRYSSIARLKAVAYFGVPKVRALFETTYIAGLLKAGMPGE
jgi:tetratricopeptide (TPR) repeat protein